MGAPSFKRYPLNHGGESRSYWPNANYGNARILKTYASYPLDEPVWAVIPHGIFYEDDYVFPGEANAPVPCVLNYPAHRDAAWSQHKEVVPCAAPFLYALDIYPHAPERRGTIVMPQHTTTLFDMEFDWAAFADSLRDLPKPITVLLYWQDIERGADKWFPYVTKTCGHVQDKDFTRKLVWHLTGAENVVSNEVGSYTQYATAAGARFRLLGTPPRLVLNDAGKAQGYEGIFLDSEQRHPEEQARIADIDDLFRDYGFDEPITENQRECADYYLRRSAKKDAAGLYADLAYCKERRRENTR